MDNDDRRWADGAEAAVGERGVTDGREEIATIAFWSLPGVGPVSLERLRTAFGSLAAALEAPEDRLAAVLPAPARTHARRLADAVRVADLVRERTERAGGRILFSGAAGWPRQLAGAPEAPPMLFLRGALAPESPRVAVVGARQTDGYGRAVAARLAGELSAAGVGVVSGGAVGVDSAAHAGALVGPSSSRPGADGLGGAGGTAVVLGCGIDVTYPRSNRGLFDDIVAAGGAVVSAFPPRTPPCEQNFPVRNRHIAALCDAVVIARAGADSGALLTAREAHRLRRPTFAVCGPMGDALSRGATLLVREGVAEPIDGAADVLAALGAAPSLKGPGKFGSSGPPVTRNPVAVEPSLRPVLDALLRGPASADTLAVAAGLPTGRVLAALTELEILGLCEPRLGGFYAATGAEAVPA